MAIRIDRDTLLAAIREEIDSWDGETPDQVAVPGQMLRDVARMLGEGDTSPSVLTLDELRALPVGAVVWYEQRAKDQTYIMPMVVTADEHIGCWALGVCMDVIGQDDRCWSARPTDEQREAEAWRA